MALRSDLGDSVVAVRTEAGDVLAVIGIEWLAGGPVSLIVQNPPPPIDPEPEPEPEPIP
jgi:hypothetical protein